MKNTAATTARARRTTRHERHASEHVVAAARAIYNRAIADGLIDHKNSPAHRVAKPRRLPNTRRALSGWELEQINAARISGNDAVLDTLILRLHTETACRRGGALGIRLEDLDPDRCLVKLREKGSTVRWQPITPALANCLVDHGTARGAVLPTDPLLRFRQGHPLTQPPLRPPMETTRRTTPLGRRPRHLHPLAPPHHPHLGRTPPRIRHRPRLRRTHTDNTGPATTTYIKANLQEVATALAAMTGQPHPLALPPWTLTADGSPSRAITLPPQPSAWHT